MALSIVSPALMASAVAGVSPGSVGGTIGATEGAAIEWTTSGCACWPDSKEIAVREMA